MYKNIKPFGIHIHNKTVGSAWIDLVNALLKEGEESPDEKRNRLALQRVRIKIDNPIIPDPILEKYGDKEKLDGIVYLTFKGEEMYDFDVVPSFTPGPQSYYSRMKEGKMIEYVIDRLSKIPESKKAIISFINWRDYELVVADHYDDYLPCLCTIQFRLIRNEKGWDMHTIWYARSLDGFQKGNGNILAISMLAEKIAKQLTENLEVPVTPKSLDGFITDVHLYGECIEQAKKMIQNYDKDNSN